MFKNLQYSKGVISKLVSAPPPPSTPLSSSPPSASLESGLDSRIQELLSQESSPPRQSQVENLSSPHLIDESISGGFPSTSHPPLGNEGGLGALFGGGGNPLGMLGGMMGMMGGEGVPGIPPELFQALASGDEQGLASIDFIGLINGVINTLTELRDTMIAEKEEATASNSHSSQSEVGSDNE
jgi:hypothetical protein